MLGYATRWMNLKNMVSEESSQTQKGPSCMIPFMRTPRKVKTIVTTTENDQWLLELRVREGRGWLQRAKSRIIGSWKYSIY